MIRCGLFAIALLVPLAQLVASEPSVKLAIFDVDATPPVGSAMAYDPVKRLDEMTLRCRGIALFGPQHEADRALRRGLARHRQ